MPLDADAIADLYDQHARALLAFLARRAADPEAAVDLLAETFAAAFKDRRRFRGDDPLPWLYGIARHQLAGYFRRGRVERRALERLGVQRRGMTPDPKQPDEGAGRGRGGGAGPPPPPETPAPRPPRARGSAGGPPPPGAPPPR